MDHSYEEIRAVALDILSGREKIQIPPDQYFTLGVGIQEVFLTRETDKQTVIENMKCGRPPRLSSEDQKTYQEVFWELFRQGIITLGIDENNLNFPFFRVSHFGKNILANQNLYFFHDVSSYLSLIKNEIPKINDVTLIYLQEAMQAFRTGCILSSTVMLGVASEHTFDLLLETIESSNRFSNIYKNVFAERTFLKKINKFKNIFDQQLQNIPSTIKEDFEINFLGIISIIRNFRNQSGHPTGKIISREQAYILLQLFIPYCKKIYELIKFFKKN